MSAVQPFSRREAMAILASAPADSLMSLWRGSALAESGTVLRGPETGLVALRGRIGGRGAPFNFGEATVTRASVKLPTGEVGHAYALGRDKEKVRLSAFIDAFRQKPDLASRIDTEILHPLASELEQRDERRQGETAATRVDFLTMTRGED